MNRLPSEKDALRERYAGEMRVSFSGNIEMAKRYLGPARVLLGALRNRLALGGITLGRSYLTLQGGGRIDAIVAGGMHQVRIYLPEIVGGDEEEIDFPYLSGLYEVARVYFEPLGSEPLKYATQFFPAFNVFDDSDRRWYRLNVGFTDNVPWPLTPDLLPGEDNDPNTRFAWGWLDRVKPTLKILGEELKGYPQWPSMYTGTIRKVVQKLLGRKMENPFHTNCAIFIPDPSRPAIDQNRWVVEIVADKLEAGVFAYPITFFDELELLTKKQTERVRAEQDTDRYDYGLEGKFTPPTGVATDIEDVLASNGRLKLRLLSADAVIAIHYQHADVRRTTMTPWYSNWAFSYSGHEAQIVLFEEREYSGLPTQYAKRFKLHIEADNKGRPSSAAIDLIDEGWVRLGDKSFQLWAPYRDPMQEQISFPSAASLPDFDSPLYVFYDKYDTEVVLRLKYKSPALLADVHEVTIDCTTPVPCIAAGFCPTPALYISVEDCYTGYELFRIGRTESTLCCYCERTFGPAYAATQQYAYRSWWAGEEQGETDWHVQCNVAFLDYVYAKGTYIQLLHYNESLHGVSQTFYNRVTLPLYEREGFFHYQSQIEEATAPYTVTNYKTSPPYSGVKWHSQLRWDGATQQVSTNYTMGGTFGAPNSVVNYPAGSILVEPGYRYIGSIINEDSDDPAIFELTTDNIGDWFSGERFSAVAVNEAFSGKFILMPEPQDSWAFSTEYPVQECYRYKNRLPTNLCFVGDGTGDDSWRLGVDEPDDFIELPPKKDKKLSTPSTPLDLYAVNLPK